MNDNPWTILSSHSVYEDGWIRLVEHKVRDASGAERPYAVVHFKKVGVRILPIDREGHTYLVGQYRFGSAYFSWELPAGGGDPDEAPRAAAERELREEAGLLAENWLPSLELVPSGSITDEQELSLIAWVFDRVDRDLDPQEVIRLRRVPFDEAVRMALSGEIRDAGSVAAILALHVKALRGDLPDDLAARMK
jgi:8-oxo-dGTP pyrophosphatase MutT (NUDIX family)